MKKLTFLLALSVLFFIGCSTEEVSTVDSSIENDSYARGIANAPDQSGMYVIRTETSAASVIVDTKTELTAVTGVDIEAFCSGDPFWELEPLQYVNIPNNDQLIFLIQGYVYTFVFDGVFDGSIPLCDFLQNTPVLAEGTSHFIYNDNDFFGTAANISNAVSIKANGQLLNQDNELKNLNAKFHGVWNQEGSFTSSTSVKLH
jgi:hypothetical protein